MPEEDNFSALFFNVLLKLLDARGAFDEALADPGAGLMGICGEPFVTFPISPLLRLLRKFQPPQLHSGERRR